MENNLNQIATEAIISLKNGIRKYGILIDLSINIETYRFISNNNLQAYKASANEAFVEKLPIDIIQSIEVDLK
jgi:hypothetical protein